MLSKGCFRKGWRLAWLPDSPVSGSWATSTCLAFATFHGVLHRKLFALAFAEAQQWGPALKWLRFENRTAATSEERGNGFRWGWGLTSVQHPVWSRIWAKVSLSSGINWFCLSICCYLQSSVTQKLERELLFPSLKSLLNGFRIDSLMSEMHIKCGDFIKSSQATNENWRLIFNFYNAKVMTE